MTIDPGSTAQVRSSYGKGNTKVRRFQQVAALDPGANAGGVTVSNAVEPTIGIR